MKSTGSNKYDTGPMAHLYGLTNGPSVKLQNSDGFLTTDSSFICKMFFQTLSKNKCVPVLAIRACH